MIGKIWDFWSVYKKLAHFGITDKILFFKSYSNFPFIVK